MCQILPVVEGLGKYTHTHSEFSYSGIKLFTDNL